jgi:uncharacterized protein (TIGR02246 family)
METTTADIDAITAIIENTEVAFNSGDADLLAGQFHDDAWAVGVTGEDLEERDEILETSRRLLAGRLRDQRARYVVDDLRFLAPDVAIVRKHAFATDAEGRDLDDHHAMVALYVLSTRDGEWRIAARQNTVVQR